MIGWLVACKVGYEMKSTDLVWSRWRSVVHVEVGGDAYSFWKIVHCLSIIFAI